MTTQTYIRHIGQNRGKPRIWLEGKCVEAAGFKVGDHFQIIYDTDSMFLVKHPEGNRKISGKGDKPIIDIAGNTVAMAFSPEVETVTVQSSTDSQGNSYIHLTANKEK